MLIDVTLNLASHTPHAEWRTKQEAQHLSFIYRNSSSSSSSSSFGRTQCEWCPTVSVDELQKILMTILEEEEEEEGRNDVLLL